MPLSPDEQRILDEIEQRLAEEDPRLVEAVSRTSLYTHLARRIKWSLLAFSVGFLMLMVFLMIVPDMLWVAAAGPAANLVMALGWAAMYKATGLLPGNYFTEPLLLMGKAGMDPRQSMTSIPVMARASSLVSRSARST